MRKHQGKLIALLMIFFLIGCGGPQAAPEDLTPADLLKQSKLAYADALKVYYDSASTFKMHFEAADPATQESWRKNIKPVFVEAKQVLDVWRMFIDEDTFPDDKTLSDWKRLKTKFILSIAEMQKE